MRVFRLYLRRDASSILPRHHSLLHQAHLRDRQTYRLFPRILHFRIRRRILRMRRPLMQRLTLLRCRPITRRRVSNHSLSRKCRTVHRRVFSLLHNHKFLTQHLNLSTPFPPNARIQILILRQRAVAKRWVGVAVVVSRLAGK